MDYPVTQVTPPKAREVPRKCRPQIGGESCLQAGYHVSLRHGLFGAWLLFFFHSHRNDLMNPGQQAAVYKQVLENELKCLNTARAMRSIKT